jgi:hypothetical protein
MNIQPVATGVPAEEIILRRNITVQRYREPQPLFNAPDQDTLEDIVE